MKKPFKLVSLVHNPTAGEGDHSKEKLIGLIESQGYRCAYSSSKNKILKSLAPETDFIVIAGGDGTIRKTIMCLLNKKLKYKRPIALLPFGTANNIATSLNIPQDNVKNISSWARYKLKNFDVGQVTGLKKTFYFIESFGFGIFPRLIKVLNQMDTEDITTSEDKLSMALNTLLNITKNYEPVTFKIEINDRLIEDQAIMIEIMNISHLGPHLKLSKGADSGDGYFDVVIVTKKDRKKMENYISKKIELKDPVFPIKPILTKNIRIYCKGEDIHGDDQVIQTNKAGSLKFSLLDGLLEMLAE